MTILTCPVCRRSIETLNAVLGKESMDQGIIVREPTFVFHYDREMRKCLAACKAVSEAERIAAVTP